MYLQYGGIHKLRDASLKIFDHPHIAKIKINQNCKTHPQSLIYGAKMFGESVETFKNFTNVFFCKVKLSKMASIETDKIKKQTALFKSNFS